MFKYYISEINLNKINTKKINNLLDVNCNKFRILLSKNGKYIINENKIDFYIMNDMDDEDLIIKNYLEKYTLFICKFNWKKVKSTSICIDHNDIFVEAYSYNMKNRKIKLIIEYFNSKILDLYILSELKYDNISLKEDISYLLSKII